MTKSVVRWGLSCLSVGLLACPSDRDEVEISSSGAALTASQNADRVLQGLVGSADFLYESSSLLQALNRVGGASGSCSSTDTLCASGSSCAPVVSCERHELEPVDVEEARSQVA